ncbi:MAG TPA: hydroxyphenylacetyl-CoA thioesterase PaaI [Rhizomicrobium sp.]|jgi:acyl-CoA thioesterase|nr:hydroxyphenylacetyl-CoA thioesterase PaaI [Rhizomicrobium sp.]
MTKAHELANKIAHTMLSREGTGAAWGIEIEDAREGYSRIAMLVRADMLNGHATCHGGMIFALADSAFAYACNSRNVTSVAQHASIAFLSPGREGDRLVAEAREEALSGRSGVYTVTVTNQKGEKIAVFQGLSRSIGGPLVADN